ncbi:MAG TPA: prolyl oligopeptidase family serine peptidase [Opitutaceae bacterium]|nr:prolyl oligopeptidase family serine peptidase [Opitutaceae bacterium]
MRTGVALAVFMIGLGASAADPSASLKYFRDLAETRNYTLGRPVSPKITPDGKAVLFLRAKPREPVLRLYELELATGREREVLTPAQLLGGAEEQLSAEEKARRERQRMSLKGFTSFELSKDGRRLLVTLSGKLYVVNRVDLKITELPGAGWIDPRFSPDGNFVAAAGADRELHVIDPAQGSERAITRGATATLSHGTAEFVAQEEMSRNEGYWWSPDSQSLLVQETDESKVEVRHVADPLHPEVAPTKFFYPRSGSANAVVRLLLVARDGSSSETVEWDNEDFPYLAHVTWEKNSPLTLQVQNREQTDLRLLAVDSRGRSRELLRETDAAWVNLDDNGAGSSADRRPPFWRKEGKEFIWTTERRGAWQVELRDAAGALVREVTPVTWGYRDFIGIDEGSDSILVRGGNDPREVHVWKFPLAGGPGIALTAKRGIHNATFFRESGLLVRTTDTFDGEYRCEVVSATDGQVIATLQSVAEAPPRLPTTELTKTIGPRVFDAAITRPRDFKAGTKYPVILDVYAGPGSKRVNANARGYFPDQWTADQGYIVVRIDGRGTPWRGRDWERVIKGNFIDVALEDQVVGLRALGQQVRELDLTRVGVAGWSFGGYFAAMAAARRPDVFRCAVAGAPVVTWENYDTHYTERYLGLPQSAPEAYRVSNVTTYAGQLSRPLMLIHGLTDDNVYFQHTLQLADALYMAGKPYELLPMLGTHMVSDPVVKLRQQTRIVEFFDRELKPRK